MITLSQTAFEQYVPAFRDAESRTYEAILPYMELFRDNAYHATKVPTSTATLPTVPCLTSTSCLPTTALPW